MKYVYAIPFQGTATLWFCEMCNRAIVPEFIPIQEHVMYVQPASRYWHGTKKLAYCSPECSLAGHA